MSEIKDPSKMIIKAKWEPYDTTLLTSKLYRHVRNGEIEFSLKAKHGTLETDFAIAVATGITSSIATLIIEKIVVYIWRRIKKQRERGRELEPVIISIDNRHYTIRGRDEDELPPFN